MTDELVPDGKLHTDGYFTWHRRNYGYVMDAALPAEFVLLKTARDAIASRNRLNWHWCKDSMPDTEKEVFVWIDGHRGPAWRNNHALVAYCNVNGDWWEERHPSRHPLVGVIAWAHIDEPDECPK